MIRYENYTDYCDMFFCSNANACECFGSLQQSLVTSEIVIKAKVIGLNDTVQYDIFSNPHYPPFKKGSKPKLKVNKVYRGKLTEKEVELTSHGSLCDPYFDFNKEYVIFISTINGKLETSVCSHNFETIDKKLLQEVKKLYNNKYYPQVT